MTAREQTLSDRFKALPASLKTGALADMGAKLDRFGSFASQKQENYFRALLVKAEAKADDMGAPQLVADQEAQDDLFDNAEPNPAPAPAPKAEHAPVSFAEYEACRSALVARTRELDAVKQERDGLRKNVQTAGEFYAKLLAERDSLQAELSALRADPKTQAKPLSEAALTALKIAHAALGAAIGAGTAPQAAPEPKKAAPEPKKAVPVQKIPAGATHMTGVCKKCKRFGFVQVASSMHDACVTK